MKISVFAVLLLAFATKEVVSQACHMREVDLCLATGMFHFQSNGVPEDEEQVDEFCESYKEVIDCLGNFSSKCMSPLQKEIIGLLAGADERATRLCTKGSESRTMYLKHGPCLAEAYEGENFKYIMKDLQVMLERMFKLDFYDRLPGLCCGLNRFELDTDRNVENICGKDAVEMLKYILNMITTDVPSAICKRYDPEGQECATVLLPRGTPDSGENKSQLGRLLDTMFSNM